MHKEKIKSLLVSGDITIKEAMRKLNESAQRILFVIDDDQKLRGTVTDGDIRRGMVRGLQFSNRVEDIMHKNFVTVKQDIADLKGHVKKVMAETMVEQIPMVDENNVIVDIIRWTDVLDVNESVKGKKRHSNNVVIMAGGKGTRLDPFTKIFPKPLIPIGNKPVIELIMEKFYKHGFFNFTYLLNYKKEYLKLYLREVGSPYAVQWIEEEDFMGTAGGLSLLNGKINEPFFVTNCDSFLDVDFEEILTWHKDHAALITIVGCHNEVKIPFGVLELSNGRLERILEKPAHDVIINTGVYVMDPKVLSYIPENTRMDMDQLISNIIKKETITVYPIYGGWFDIGQWEEYKKSLEQIGERDV